MVLVYMTPKKLNKLSLFLALDNDGYRFDNVRKMEFRTLYRVEAQKGVVPKGPRLLKYFTYTVAKAHTLFDFNILGDYFMINCPNVSNTRRAS